LSILRAGSAVAAAWLAAWGIAGASEAKKARADPTADYVVRLPRDVEVFHWRLDLSGDVRMREEWWHDVDLNHRVDDDDARFYVRTRLRADLAFDEAARAVVELFDGREWDTDRRPPQNDELDVHQAYLQFDGVGGLPLMVRLGRQEIDLGSRRLVAAPSWGNLLRAFDGARLTYASDLLDVHAFCGSVVACVDDEFDEHTPGQRLFGLFTTLKPLSPHKLDLYALGLVDHKHNFKGEDGAMGTRSIYTFGTRLYGPFAERWTYEVEAVLQRGHYAGDKVRAWAFHADTAYTLPLPWQPTVQVYANCASGDKNPTDGKRNTFDPLFTSSHNMYGGIMDLVTWMNVKVVGARLKLKPVPKLTLMAEADCYRLDEEADAWYPTSKKAKRRDTAGRSGDAIGRELGLTAKCAVTKQFDLEGGVARFFPGAFVRSTGTHDGMTFAYLQTLFRF